MKPTVGINLANGNKRSKGDCWSKYNFPLNNSERANKLLLNDHSESILSTKVIRYLEGVLDDKTLSRDTYVHKHNIKLNRPCLLCAWV